MSGAVEGQLPPDLPAVLPGELPGDARTRDRVAKALLERGPSTTAALAGRLGLTPPAVRRHLDAMIAAGVVSEAAERKVRGASRGRGRPARLFALTESGRAAFPHSYDDLAADALRFLGERMGGAAVADFAQARVAGLEERYRDRVAEGATPEDRAVALAEALSGDGYAASTARAGAGVQICQHHCPVQHVAEQFPQLCEAETAVFGRLLGTHVQRLATIAHGDGVCTTHVPTSTSAAERTTR
ncbi:MAG: helix-turn-helix transcriptional regulator [Frankiaceae bacterium]